MSQTKKIYKYLQEYPEGLNPLDALVKFGSMRLAARINDIKKTLRVDEKIITCDERKNNKIYARYKLIRIKPETNTQIKFL